MIDLDRIVATAQCNSKEEENYIKYSEDFGMRCEWLHHKFKNKLSNCIFELLGLYKKGSLVMVSIQEENGVKRTYNLKHFLENCEIVD